MAVHVRYYHRPDTRTVWRLTVRTDGIYPRRRLPTSKLKGWWVSGHLERVSATGPSEVKEIRSEPFYVDREGTEARAVSNFIATAWPKGADEIDQSRYVELRALYGI